MAVKGISITSYLGRFKGALAILILCLFISVLIVQALHRHAETQSSSASFLSGAVAKEKSVGELQLKCEICDYILHKQGQQLQPEQPPQVAVYYAPAIQSTPPYKASIPKLSFFSWTNKGPPQV